MNLPALLLQSFEVFARCASSNCYEALWQKCMFFPLALRSFIRNVGYAEVTFTRKCKEK